MTSDLHFNNGRFRIMLVGDPHQKVNDNSAESVSKIKDYLLFQHKASEELKPQLAVLMGDNASGSDTREIRDVLLRITAPYRENDIPFTFILGNHDLESKVSDLNTQYEIYKSLPGICFPEEFSDNGDYVIQIKSSFSDSPVLNLWHFYNGAHPEKRYNSHYSAASEEQLNWFETKSKELSKENKIPGIVFQHVPVKEEYDLLNEIGTLAGIADGVPGQDGHYGKYYKLKNNVEGYLGESPCIADYDIGQFDSWKKSGDIIAAFFGHDHMNDFSGKVNDIYLGQCKTASFNVYGDGLHQGVRIIDLYEQNMKDFSSEMVYYRDLIGTDCNSITGRNKIFHDKINVKIDVLEQVAKVGLPLSAILFTLKLLSKKD